MADKINEAVEKEVTCPLCLEIFKEPKRLPCDHVYCKDCLQGLVAQRSIGRSISCPECRNVTDIPNNDVSNFPTAFSVNRLVEAFQETQEESEKHRQVTTDNPIKSCKVHATQPLALYCETCKTMLCRDCVLMTKDHAMHHYDYIEKFARKYQEKHEKGLQTIKEYEELLSQAQSKLVGVESTIATNENVSLEEIDRAFEDLHKTLEKNKQVLKQQLSQHYQSASHTAIENKHQIKSIQTQATTVTALVEGALRGNDEAFLTQEAEIDHIVENFQLKIEQFLSTVEPALQVPDVMSCEMLQKQLDTCNFLYTPADPTKSKIDLNTRTSTGRNTGCILTVNLVDSKGNKCLRGSQKLQVELYSFRDDTTTAGKIQRLSSGNVTISFSSLKRGRNRISVTVRGIHVANSPQSINFFKPVYQFNQPVALIGDLKRPAGLTSCGRSFLAIEYSRNTICKFNNTFEIFAEYGQDKLQGPIGLATDQERNVYVSTVKDHKLHKFGMNGMHIKTGKQGEQPGEFNYPMGLRINSRQELYVCDSRNNRLQVFDLQLNFKHVFGEQQGIKFHFPSDVDFDDSDNIYVCDSHNDRIQVFTPQGQFTHFIGYKTPEIKELQLPLKLSIFNGLLFVTQTKKDHVTVFETSGELVTRFGQGILQQPEGIQVDPDGYAYVSSHQSKIFVF